MLALFHNHPLPPYSFGLAPLEGCLALLASVLLRDACIYFWSSPTTKNSSESSGGPSTNTSPSVRERNRELFFVFHLLIEPCSKKKLFRFVSVAWIKTQFSLGSSWKAKNPSQIYIRSSFRNRYRILWFLFPFLRDHRERSNVLILFQLKCKKKKKWLIFPFFFWCGLKSNLFFLCLGSRGNGKQWKKWTRRKNGGLYPEFFREYRNWIDVFVWRKRRKKSRKIDGNREEKTRRVQLLISFFFVYAL